MVKVRYQGCAKAGLFYPPEVISIPLSVISGDQVKNIEQNNATDETATAQSTFTALNEPATEPTTNSDAVNTPALANQAPQQLNQALHR